MRCRILRAIDDYELNIRDTDEIGESWGLSDDAITEMENVLRRDGRYWLDADTIVKPQLRR